jgi:hypothetical protein
VRNRPHEANGIRETERAGKLLQLRAVGAVADDGHLAAGHGRADPGQRLDQEAHALLGAQAAHADHERAVTQAEDWQLKLFEKVRA